MANWQKLPNTEKYRHSLPICQEMTGMPLSKVLALTPTSGTTEPKSRSDQKRDHRRRMWDVKQTLQQELQIRDSKMLFHQRLSYRKYNAIRLTESFESIKEATECIVSNQIKI